MKSMFHLIAMAVVTGLSLALPAQAEESQAQEQKQAQQGDAADSAAEELVGQGALAKDQAEAFKAQVRERLRLHEGQGQVCQEGDKAQCQLRLRKHVRECVGAGRQSGSLHSTEDSARVAAALMIAARNSEDLDEAGEAIRAQLGKQWKAGDIEDSERTLGQMGEQKRWRKQAREMLRECVQDDSCSPEHARATLQVMQQASRRADLDPRECRREIKLAIKEMRQEAKGQAGQGSGDQLRSRLQKRLRLHAQDEATAGNGSGQQKRNRYRRGMDGESRQGGGFGGEQSGGAGAGWGGGTGGGNGGGGPHGKGGN